ncbi:hypothetical protein MLD38_013925 [Melastoma candidum]|uniref:Uncharacterized protein n=1 Tax=Melastoma candidum TaxID=119954 RepID=A0ACB9RB70_9MYRT|nr:hypothetical protein MLD38_013925 [Melastoma candidum]
MRFVALIRIKNGNFGPYKFDASIVNFTFGGAVVSQTVVPGSKVNFKSTKKIDVETDQCVRKRQNLIPFASQGGIRSRQLIEDVLAQGLGPTLAFPTNDSHQLFLPCPSRLNPVFITQKSQRDRSGEDKATYAKGGLRYLHNLNAANIPAELIQKGQNRVIDASLTPFTSYICKLLGRIYLF